MPADLLKDILKQYDIGELVDFTKIPIGVSSDNYKVETSKGTYFLKKHRESALERIGSLERIEQFFVANDIPIIVPVSTIDKKLHFIHEGTCYVMYPFVSGITFEQGKVSNEMVVHMAQMLAHMHLLTKDGIQETYGDVSMDFVLRKTEVIVEEIDTLLKQVEVLEQKTEYDILAQQGLRLKRQLLIKNKLEIDTFGFETFNLAHGDYHPGNIFFNDDLTISAIFDLDMSGPIPRVYELVRSTMLTCPNHDYSEEKIRQAELFIKTYYELYPFTKEELANAMEAFYFKTLSVWREKAHYYENDGRTDGEYEKTLRSIDYLTDHRSDLVDMLYESL